MQYDHVSNLYGKAFKELKDPPRGCALPWMPLVTQYLGGLRPNEVTLLCAPTGTGKTELLATMAAQLVSSGIPTFVAPVETGDVDFTARTISTISRKNLNHGLPVAPIVLEEIEMQHGERIRSMPLYIANYDNRVKIEEIESVLEFSHQQNGIRVALLDNLNFFLEVVSSDKEKMELDNAIHRLVMFAKRCPIHTILVVHPRKTLNGRVESEFDIKGSSTAVQECANIALFNRPTEQQIKDGESPNSRELIFKKIRKRGYDVNKPIWLSYEHGHYAELVNEPKKTFSGPAKNQRFILGRDD